VSLALAFILGFIATRLKLPALLGYLLAGAFLGPATPGFVADLKLSAQLAEIGVMLLMFGVGLHFSVGDLLSVRKIAVPGAMLQIATATLLGFFVAQGWGWEFGESLVFGLSLSVASTVVLLKALEQYNILKSVNGQIAVGWLIVEDLVMVLLLVLLPPLSTLILGGGANVVLGPDLFFSLLKTIIKITLFIALMLVIGKRFFPWLLWQVAKTGSQELFTLCVISAALGIAYVSSELFGVSFALGAFFAGVVMRESHLSHRAAEKSLPLRDAFAVLFFVSVGMLLDPEVFIEQPGHVLATVLIIIIGKSVVAFGLVLAFRYPLNTALIVSASLAQIGEFSFILVGLSVQLGIFSPENQSVVLASAIISIALNPFIFQTIKPVQNWVLRRSKLARRLEKPDDPLAELPMTKETAEIGKHVVLVGYGRVGRRIAEALQLNGMTVVVAEQNREQVEKLRDHGIHAVVGDVADPAVLIQAHVARAATLVIAISDLVRTRQMIEVARMLNPSIDILVRTHSDEEMALLKNEGIEHVFFGEHELAQSMISHLLGKSTH
jgi:monovalent cation:H+ antiporter-2, CPA2 family